MSSSTNALTSGCDGIDITAVTRLKHADLYSAAKRMGGASALARHLGVSPSKIGEWINLQSVPPLQANGRSWTDERIAELDCKLMEVTGKCAEELFPKELRDNVAFLQSPKTFEKTQRIEAEAIASYAERTRRRLVSSGDEAEIAANNRTRIEQAMQMLSQRERKVIELRYGLDGDHARTLEEVGAQLQVTKERVRQIEFKAIRKLQHNDIAHGILGGGVNGDERQLKLEAQA